ncbi:MAG: manganese efflux pump [Lachnospiraceae bacterium]|nr:manganese efflux pump [Lachnospiraceae bacterium]
MDAFSVSLAGGLNEPKMKQKRMCLIAGVFAGFQALMPMLGWVCVHTVVTLFESFEKFIPWIALVLLLFLGGRMIYEGLRRKEDEDVPAASAKLLLVQGIATSIDALSVGFTVFEGYDFLTAVIAALIIAAVTFVICIAGLFIGRKLGTAIGGKATIVGGIILIAIGLRIFIKGVF